MSRLIKKSIAVPENVTIVVHGNLATVKGAKGELAVAVPIGVEITTESKAVWVKIAADGTISPMFGTTWSLLKNAIAGVSEGFTKILEIEGVGYRAAVEGKELVLNLGYALPVRVPILEGVTVTVDKNMIKVSGIDKDLVGRAAAEIRALKKPEPYKGKGIHYQGEVIRRKVGKKAGATAA
jgi:large subunit ribosomal protein L6